MPLGFNLRHKSSIDDSLLFSYAFIYFVDHNSNFSHINAQ